MSDISAKLEEVKDRSDIVEVVSGYLTLKKSGRNYLGLCPFHQEKTPSFSVNPEKQFFHCFGCGKGGDIVSFLMEMEQIPYMEAMRRLAKRLGIVLPQRTGNDQEVSLKTKLIGINKLAGDFFVQNLKNAAGHAARDYLEKRSLPRETTETFRLGFAPDGWHNLKNYLGKMKVSLGDACSVGLLSQRDDGGYYDKFRNRLIFPIHNIAGDVVAFGGRVIGEGEPKPKYLNSPETPIYNKGSNLYGLFQAPEHIKKEGSVIVVEGYIDLLALWSGGVKNVVATLGTALTDTQARLIKRFCSTAHIVFDADNAGQQAMIRSWEIFLSGGIEAKAVVLPEGKDPDDFIKERGGNALKREVARAEPLADYFFYNTIGKTRGTAQLNAAIKEIAPMIAEIKDDIARSIFIRLIEERSGVPEAALLEEIAAARKVRPKSMAITPPVAAAALREPLDDWEMDIIRIMAEFPDVIEIVAVEDVLALFTTEYLKNIGEMIISAKKVAGRIDAMDTLRHLIDDDTKKEVMRHITMGAPCEKGNSAQTARDIIVRIKQRDCRRLSRELRAKLAEAQKAGDIERELEILARLQEIKTREQRLKLKQ